ncbi:tetratricopeptide repeat protein [Aureimonas sp. ME7]|uniref:tetratricopeptide repeat protein n=1 Tax=Aureimonas sp. ME7 TaxID=2744252 RepID=UPI0015F38935|nr:tetratricopeptide repeat protein [Aureimonas sp. ME7]
MAEEPMVVAIEDAGQPSGETDFRTRVERMRATLDDANARFSASAAVAELNALRAYAGTRPELLPERREILSMIGAIASRSSLMEFEDGLEPLRELMILGEGDTRSPKRRLNDHYTYAELAAGQAWLPGHSGGHALAAEHYGLAAALADGLPDYTDDQRAGMREKQAYELHEAGRYEEALAVNRDVLSEGERLFGAEDAKLKTVLTNIAQNLHAMERKAEAEPYLVRVQGIAEVGEDIETVQDMLFQRGVLAFELGQPAEARAFMRERIARLEAAGDPELLATAKEDYAELERRLSKP